MWGHRVERWTIMTHRPRRRGTKYTVGCLQACGERQHRKQSKRHPDATVPHKTPPHTCTLTYSHTHTLEASPPAGCSANGSRPQGQRSCCSQNPTTSRRSGQANNCAHPPHRWCPPMASTAYLDKGRCPSRHRRTPHCMRCTRTRSCSQPSSTGCPMDTRYTGACCRCCRCLGGTALPQRTWSQGHSTALGLSTRLGSW